MLRSLFKGASAPLMPAMDHEINVKSQIEARGGGVSMIRRVNLYAGPSTRGDRECQ